MSGYLLVYVAISLPVTASWYWSRLYRLGLRTAKFLSAIRLRTATAIRLRLRRFLSENGEGTGLEEV